MGDTIVGVNALSSVLCEESQIPISLRACLRERYNLLPFLGQFVTLLVSARISDVSGILIHRSRISEIILYQLCYSYVSAVYQANYIVSS